MNLKIKNECCRNILQNIFGKPGACCVTKESEKKKD